MDYMETGSVNDLENIHQIPWDSLQNYYWFDICNGTITRVGLKIQIWIQRKLL